MAGQPIIVIKKVTHGKHAHHGGAWKVAYADFVTAMMAFFLVMWLVSQNQETRKTVAQYFRDPGAFELGGRGVLPGTDRGTMGGGQTGAPSEISQSKAVIEQAAQHLRDTLASKFGDIQDRIDIVVTDDGLLIELREAPNGGFFGSGSAAAKPETVRVLAAIASELGQLKNHIAVEGHTDSTPYASTDGYSNWELSTDRANAARRILESTGLRHGQVEAVRGYADTKLRAPDQPGDPGNRRISIFVRREAQPRVVAPETTKRTPASPDATTEATEATGQPAAEVAAGAAEEPTDRPPGRRTRPAAAETAPRARTAPDPTAH